MQAGLQRPERRNLIAAESLRGIGLGDDGLKVVRRNVGGEAADHLESQPAVIHAAHRLKFGLTQFRIMVGNRQTTVVGEAAEQDFSKGFCGHAAAGAGVFHVLNSSTVGRNNQRALRRMYGKTFGAMRYAYYTLRALSLS